MPFAIIPERKAEDLIQGTEGEEEETDQRSEDMKSVRLVNELQGGGGFGEEMAKLGSFSRLASGENPLSLRVSFPYYMRL